METTVIVFAQLAIQVFTARPITHVKQINVKTVLHHNQMVMYATVYVQQDILVLSVRHTTHV
jgi:hypothetical protein